MRKTAFASLLLLALCGNSSAQVPVTQDLKFHVDATLYGSLLSPPPTLVWFDQSGWGNDVAAANSASSPTWTANAMGSGFAGLVFDGTDDVLTRSVSSTAGFTNPFATVFIVRIANAMNTTIGPLTPQWNVMMSIGQNNTYSNSFSMMGDWAVHSSSRGNWVNRSHSCYPNLPACSPAIVTGVMRTGVGAGDLDYYVNGKLSTNAPNTQGNPVAYTSANRGISVGASWGNVSNSIVPGTYFHGAILEMLAYDRVLTAAEIATVHQYLKNRYSILYNCGPTTCDPDFTWSMSTTLPNQYTFTAQNPNLPYKYIWTENGDTVGTGPVLSRAYATTPAQSYKICLNLVDCEGVACSQCFDLCHGDRDNIDDYSGGTCNNHFTISGNTNNPMQVTLTSASGGAFKWSAYNGPLTGSPYDSSPTAAAFHTFNVSAFGSYHGFKMTSPTNPSCYRVSKNHCFYSNKPSSYRPANAPLALNELKDHDQLGVSVVPNPASDLVTLQFDSPAQEQLQIRISDMSGKVVHLSDAATGTDEVTVSLEQFPAGMYFVQRGNMLELHAKFVKR